MQPRSTLEIRELSLSDIEAAAQMLAVGMQDNPLHIRVFAGADARREGALQQLFAKLLRRQLREGVILGAHTRSELAGVAAMVPPGSCQPTLSEQAAMLPALLRGRMLHRSGPILRWLHAWSRHDAAAPPHWHLGPAAVHRRQRGHGIGSALLGELCARLDNHEGCGYLETDKPENVRLYRRYGFETYAEEDVLGVRNWFMLRRWPASRNADTIASTSRTAVAAVRRR